MSRSGSGPAEVATSPAGAIDRAVERAIGPFLTGFVDAVLRDARARGLERLAFVSRDGQVLLRIARALGDADGALRYDYLYGSRQAWLLAAHALGDGSPPDWLRLPDHSTAPRHVLARLDLEPEEVADALSRVGLGSRWDVELPRRDLGIYDRLIAQPDVAARIRARAEAARDRTLAYLAQEGFDRCERWALVDVGWRLRTLRALRNLLAAAGRPRPELGYYLALRARRLAESEAGPVFGWVREEAADAPRAIFHCANVVEQVFTLADHGTVRGYAERDGRIEPVLTEPTDDSGRQRFAVELQRRLAGFAAAYRRAGLDRQELGPARARALAEVARLLGRPRADEAAALAELPIGDDQNEARRIPLARPVGVGDVVLLALRGARLLDAASVPPRFGWLEGSLALTPAPVRALGSLLRAGRAMRERFSGFP
jgi:hypothetical protein